MVPTFSEEDIRSNILIPLLTAIGIEQGDISLERTFSIQLGRGVYNVTNEERKFIGGRLDILCKVAGRNFMIVELKAEDVPIDKHGDSGQGLSYARLLRPMAPYVMVTNGRETYLYESLHGMEIPSTQLSSSDYFVSLEEEVLLRFNGLKKFIGYSINNLFILCEEISNRHLRLFTASHEDSIETKLKKKYIPEVFVARDDIQSSFQAFIAQKEKHLYIVTGESGVGKTNVIIDIFKKIDQHPAIFYSGTLLGNSIFEELKFDFNLEFSSQETALSIFKKISSLAEIHNKPFFLFIDALDEWLAPEKVKQFETLVMICAKLNIKVFATCKDLLWNNFLSYNGYPSSIDVQIYKHEFLTNFSDAEQSKALEKYNELLNIKGGDQMLSPMLQNPFSLRVAYEVSYFNELPVIAEQDAEEMLRLYVTQKINRSQNPEKSQRYVVEITRLLFEGNKVHEEEQVLRRKMNISINEELEESLFLNNLLYRISIDTVIFIGFYFSKIRDFIMVQNILRLKKQPPTKKIEIIQNALTNFIGENAINFYFKNCTGIERGLCLEAIIGYDQDKRVSNLFRLIAQYSLAWYRSLTKDLVDTIAQQVENVISDYPYNQTTNDEIKVILFKIGLDFGMEERLVTFLPILNKSSMGYILSFDICRILGAGDDPIITQTLTDYLLDRHFNSSIRRAIVDALDKRRMDNRLSVFLALLQEDIVDKDGVFFYVKSWYRLIEDEMLRDKLLALFDSSETRIQNMLTTSLSYSSLKDTGQLLFQRFNDNKYPDATTWWLCRAICSLNVQEAIPTFINIIRKDSSSELSGHLMIGLGEMKVIAVIPVLFEIIRNLDPKFKNEIWLTHIFKNVATEKEYNELFQLAFQSSNISTQVYSANVLSAVRNNRYYNFVLSVLKNEMIEEKARLSIMKDWLTSLVSLEGSTAGYHYIAHYTGPENVLSTSQLNDLYRLVERNNELSIISFAMLLNFEIDIKRLARMIKQQLIDFTAPIDTRQFHLCNEWVLRGLAIELNSWLRLTFFSNEWSKRNYLYNCLQLAGLLGDVSVLEAIEANKVSIIQSLPQFNDDPKRKERYFDFICHTIRSGNEGVRFRLDPWL